jgi:uncharacterized membrane protein YkoI
MSQAFRKTVIALTALLAVAGYATSASADDDAEDQARARAAVARGEALPVSRILEIAQHEIPGQVIEVELEWDHDRLEYEVKVLTDAGRVREIEIDASNGRVLSVEDD